MNEERLAQALSKFRRKRNLDNLPDRSSCGSPDSAMTPLPRIAGDQTPTEKPRRKLKFKRNSLQYRISQTNKDEDLRRKAELRSNTSQRAVSIEEKESLIRLKHLPVIRDKL